ncbi:hypothetical protein Nepgr_006643 [Nepenthes gracilis]|uniref:Uncharacterized protein n=1 Tax=Nepenthes gracilis TaxID=150966 RepID=A0AAD3S5E3_NEPGR|nr:hypothetical protein Nepgr_006643 [Nepenthes gracilis]
MCSSIQEPKYRRMEPASHPAYAPSELLSSCILNLQQGSTAAISKCAHICSELEQAPSANSPAPQRQLNIPAPTTSLQHQPSAGANTIPKNGIEHQQERLCISQNGSGGHISTGGNKI